MLEGCRRLGFLPEKLDEDQLTQTACWIIGIITMCATASVVAGLDVGIKSVSYVAFMLGNFLILVVFCLDETWYILNVLVSSLGFHLQHIIEISFDTDAFAQLRPGNGQPNDGLGADPSWMNGWTIFYWGWWIAWAPFVGTFMARVSRGRTIKQVVLYTLTIPCGYAFLWFWDLWCSRDPHGSSCHVLGRDWAQDAQQQQLLPPYLRRFPAEHDWQLLQCPSNFAQRHRLCSESLCDSCLQLCRCR